MATIKVERKEIVELEVNYPAFKKHGNGCYKVTENETIEVRTDDDKGFRIGKVCYTDLVLLNGSDITEREFNAAFMEVLEFVLSRSPLS